MDETRRKRRARQSELGANLDTPKLNLNSIVTHIEDKGAEGSG